MDEFTIFLGISLALDSLITLCLSMEYVSARKLYNIFTETLNNGINSVTLTEIQKSQHPLHVVVRGKVKAIGPPIKSLNKPWTNGVIQRLTVKEHAIQKSYYGTWLSRENIIDSKFDVVPFEIVDDIYRVTVTSPLNACRLNLTVIEDHFEPTVSSIVNILFGFHRKGFQYSEFLLKEDAILTGFGEIVADSNGKLYLIPPKNGIDYILTIMDPETLAHELKLEEKFYSVMCALFFSVGICIVGVLMYRWWSKRKIRLEMEKMRKEIIRQRENRTNNFTDDSFTCIICCIHPREVVLLPCGHVSFCLDCSSQLAESPCPLCRQKVTKQHLIYLS